MLQLKAAEPQGNDTGYLSIYQLGTGVPELNTNEVHRGLLEVHAQFIIV